MPASSPQLASRDAVATVFKKWRSPSDGDELNAERNLSLKSDVKRSAYYNSPAHVTEQAM